MFSSSNADVLCPRPHAVGLFVLEDKYVHKYLKDRTSVLLLLAHAYSNSLVPFLELQIGLTRYAAAFKLYSNTVFAERNA